MKKYSISAEAFLTLRHQEVVTIIDLRTPAEHLSERLEDASLMPVSDINSNQLEAHLSKHDASTKKIYLLCQSGKRAEMACDKLAESDFDLCIIEGGLNALKAAGVDTVTSDKKTISLERQVRIAAGALVLLGGILGFSLHPYFFLLSMAIGAGLVFAGISDTCAMGMALMRMPWNQRKIH
jgi:rhodanese-related sulfurtransferase